LRSRLVSGLTVPLVPPSLDTRLAILERLAAARDLKLGHPVLRAIAEGIRGSVRELIGTLVHLEMVSRTEGSPLDMDHVRDYLQQRSASRPARVRDIAAATARHFALRVAELRSPSRRRAVVRARGVAMYLTRRLTEESLEQIGHYFGGRDHTTVLHGCRKNRGSDAVGAGRPQGGAFNLNNTFYPPFVAAK